MVLRGSEDVDEDDSELDEEEDDEDELEDDDEEEEEEDEEEEDDELEEEDDNEDEDRLIDEELSEIFPRSEERAASVRMDADADATGFAICGCVLSRALRMKS